MAAPAGDLGAAVERYAGVVFDVDGVLLRLDSPIPGAGTAVAALRRRGSGVAFITNNAGRTPADVAAALTEAGVQATAGEVVTSAVVAADLLAPGTRCLVIGMGGLRAALAERGCVEVTDPGDAEAVVVGWDRDLRWDDLRRATLALVRGARFLATNTDATYPAAEGPWPGNGATVAALRTASGREPEVAGKPAAAMFRLAARRLGDRGPFLMVGDRPETDLAGAAALGWDTALVLSGVTPPAAAAQVRPRPTYVADDVAALLTLPQAVSPEAGVSSQAAERGRR